MDKSLRQQKLIEIVTKVEVNTQEELIEILEAQGLKVTQATISRDINELGLKKTAGTTKKYRYAQIIEKTSDDNKLLRLFKTAVLHIEAAQNLVVVKALSGNGSSVAAVIDAQKYEEVVGTLAGDDTVLIITKDNNFAQLVCQKLQQML